MPRGIMRAPVSVVVFDTELRIAWVNETAERLIGGPPATGWAGRRLGEVLPGMDAGLVERSLRRVLGTGPPLRGLGVGSPGGGRPAWEGFWRSTPFHGGRAERDGPSGGCLSGLTARH